MDRLLQEPFKVNSVKSWVHTYIHKTKNFSRSEADLISRSEADLDLNYVELVGSWLTHFVYNYNFVSKSRSFPVRVPGFSTPKMDEMINKIDEVQQRLSCKLDPLGLTH